MWVMETQISSGGLSLPVLSSRRLHANDDNETLENKS